MSQGLEFDWLNHSEAYAIGEGVIQTAGGEIDFRLKVPKEIEDDHPIVVSPGFTDSRHGTDRLTNFYAEQNRVGVSFSHPRVYHPEFEDDPEGHKSSNIKCVVEALDSKKVQKSGKQILRLAGSVDLEGHSEGAANASRFASEHPEAVRTFISVAGGGLIEDDSQYKIMFRAIRNPLTGLRHMMHLAAHPVHDILMSRRVADYILSNPPKAAEEAARISTADTRGRILVLSRKKDIPTGALQFLADELFPYKLVHESTDQGRIFDLFEAFTDKRAGHLTPQFHPRKVGAQLLDMTTRLSRLAELQQAA